jgi:hypothetical protein
MQGAGTSWSVVVHRGALLGVSFLLSPRHPVFIALPCLGSICLLPLKCLDIAAPSFAVGLLE